MKAILIIFNQSHTEKIEYMLDYLNIRGYTMWTEVKGRGTKDGEPRMGTHTWPELNNAILAVVQDCQIDTIFNKIEKIDSLNKSVGIRAFVWSIEKIY